MNNLNDIIPNLRTLQSGKSMVYYRGFLARDRKDNGNGNTDIGQIANIAYELYRSGKICLTQKRSGDAFEYIATAVTK